MLREFCWSYSSKSIAQQRKSFLFKIFHFLFKICYILILELSRWNTRNFFYYSKTCSNLTKRISCWSLGQPIFLISGSSITFNYWIQFVLSNILGSLFSLTYFLYISFFSRINCFAFLLIHGGSLSSNVTVSWGM